MHRRQSVVGGVRLYLKDQFFLEECGTILERVRAKYMQTCRDGHAERKQEKLRRKS